MRVEALRSEALRSEPLRRALRGARTVLRAAWAELDAAIYPRLCWLCRARACVDGLGCAAHALTSARFEPAEARCTGCLARLPAGMGAGLCAGCRRSARGYRQLLAAGPYRPGEALAEWILAFKHGGRAELDRPLAAFLATEVEAHGGVPPGAVLVSVPLHPLRRLERGFDQGRRLARALADELGLEHVPALRRRRWTPPQGAPGARSRAANVAGAFGLVARRRGRIAGREVWLVDDVVTSGATVRACAEELRRGGAREVSVVALARAERADEA